MWGQKAPSKQQSDGKKRPQNHKVGAESAPAQIRAEKVWGQKVPSKCKSGGKKRRQNSKVTAKSATTYHIQGAGAPAKTKNYVNADGVYIFCGKGPTFSASCKTYKQNFLKG